MAKANLETYTNERNQEMIEDIYKFIQGFDLHNILTLVLIVWYFTKDVKKSIDELDKDVRMMNTRISRIEGTVYGKEIYSHISE